MQYMLVLIVLAPLVIAIDVFHPKPLAVDFGQSVLQHGDNVDIVTGSAFSGLMTFANLPYSNCFVDDGVAGYDIAILGAPFDTVRCFV